MLVFGDRERRCDPRAALDEIARALDEIEAATVDAADAASPLARHGAIAGAFVDAGELAAGELADRFCNLQIGFT